MRKLYIVRLTKQERVELQAVVKKLKGTGQKVRHAQILLKADADGANWTDERIAEAFSCRTRTVERLRQRFIEQGFEETLNRVERKQPLVEKVVDGRPRGTHHRDAPGSATERLQQLDAAAVGTQGRGVGNRGLSEPRNGPAHALKNGMTNRKIEYWVIPPEADGEFVAHMEEVLETYEKPYDPTCPSCAWTNSLCSC